MPNITQEELAAWTKSIQSRSQNSKFRKIQQKQLQAWSEALVVALNERLSQYNIEGLYAEMEDDSEGKTNSPTSTLYSRPLT